MSSVLSPVQPSASYALPDSEAPYPGSRGGSSSSSSTGTFPLGYETREQCIQTTRARQAALSPAPRPNLVRRETDQILSYYQSEHAGRPFDYATAAAEAPNHTQDAHPSSTTASATAHHARKASTFSSASDYSSQYSSETESLVVPEPTTATAAEFQINTPVRSSAQPEPPASSSENPRAHAAPVPAAQRHSRRPSVPTEGGADRRRLAIVEMDADAPIARKRSKGLKSKSSHDSSVSSAASNMSGGTLFSRRGVHIGGLALVAPPDASPKTYTDLTPPSTAPVVAGRASHPPPPSASSGHASGSHYHAHARSASEAVDYSSSRSVGRSRRLHHKSSRDVGIVGLSSASTASDSLGPASPTSDEYHVYVQAVRPREGLGVPVFQTPAKSRSPSPGGGGGGTTPDLSDTSSASHGQQRLLATPIWGMEDSGIVTPGIGEWKDIQQPVVGPVIVGLSPDQLMHHHHSHHSPHRTDSSSTVSQSQQQQQQRQQSPARSHASYASPSSSSSPSVQSPTSAYQQSQSPLSPSSSSSTAASPYLHYQPGVHSTAGPLPPPPRSIFDTHGAPPPRPPRFHTPVPSASATSTSPSASNTHTSTRRDVDVLKEQLQLPQSVSAVLAARTPPEAANKRLGHGHEGPTPEPHPQPRGRSHSRTRSRSGTRDSDASSYSQDNGANNNESSVKLVPATSVHRREGAFPPSTILSSPPGQLLVDSPRASEETSTGNTTQSQNTDGRPVVVIEHDNQAEQTREGEGAGGEDVLPRERKDSDRRSGIELRRESSWVSLSQEAAAHHSSPNGKSAVLPAVSVSRSASSSSASSGSRSASSHLPVPPPKNAARSGSDDEKAGASLAPSAFRATLTNLKRFSSLPRTPSRSSRSSSSKRSTSPSPDVRRSLSPSAAPIRVELPTSTAGARRPVQERKVLPKPTMVSSWPPAMNVRDVTMLRSARERAKAYADKINELAMYDCGLRDWQAAQGRPGSHPRTQSQRTARNTLQPMVPAELGGMPPQGRHVSHGSLASEATFPIRADAYTATDLSTRPIDVIPSTAPPPPPSLPYPALAQAQGISRTQTRSSTLLSSPTKTLAILPGGKSSGTGFFASLGRKTSVRKEKGLSGLSSPQSPTKVLTKRPPAVTMSRSNPTPPTQSSMASPRDGPLPSVPVIPGGPRAAPGRIQRAKTYSVAPSPPQAQPQPQPEPAPTSRPSPPNSHRQSTVARRPSLFARARQGHVSISPPIAASSAAMSMDPSFQRQVDKLAAILPHADRDILAGYLRRAGEDILAIGQYLEDEKNGTLRRD
ncbi:hypothetical protein OH77DRAFT_1400943 [Trametes cingulata]|nr:hypothetical protein OH77DRAFT_1400943 [Trametes cingulata]